MNDDETKEAGYWKVDKSSNLYKETINTFRKGIDDVNSRVFGGSTIDWIFSIKDKVTSGEKTEEEFQRDRKRFLNPSRNQLGNKIKWKNFRPYVMNFYHEALEVPGVRQRIIDRMGEKLFMQQDPFVLVDDQVITDDLYEVILIHHIEQFQLKQKNFDEKLPQLRAQFREKILKAIQEGRIKIDPARAEEIANIPILLFDDLSNDDYIGGYYNSQANVVYISSLNIETEPLETVIHELTHGLSGNTFVGFKDREEEAKDDTDVSEAFKTLMRKLSRRGMEEELQIQRLGLSFAGSCIKAERFGWLNEAITEVIAADIIGDNPEREPEDRGIARIEERALLKLLRHSGKFDIPLDLFKDAYFEEYDPNLPYGERIPAWKKLYTAINEAYYPGFLVELDKVYKGAVDINNLPT